MFDQLFERPHALARQLSAPLVEEGRQYLSLCHAQEFSRSSLRLTAQLLVATAEYLKLDDRPSSIITLQEVEEAGSRWSQRVSLLPIENPRLSASPTILWSLTLLTSCGTSEASRLRRLSYVLSLCGPFRVGSVWANVHSTLSPSPMSILLWLSR